MEPAVRGAGHAKRRRGATGLVGAPGIRTNPTAASRKKSGDRFLRRPDRFGHPDSPHRRRAVVIPANRLLFSDAIQVDSFASWFLEPKNLFLPLLLTWWGCVDLGRETTKESNGFACSAWFRSFFLDRIECLFPIESGVRISKLGICFLGDDESKRKRERKKKGKERV